MTRKKVHFIGIGGIGVSALARYYLKQDWEVTGSDLESSEITTAFQKEGAKIIIGKHQAKNLPKDVSLVIYSPAVKKGNPELKKAYEFQKSKSNIQHLISNIQIKSYPEALGELTKKYFTIAVSGTHGKSTTTAMIGLLLIKAGLNPTVILGTKLKEFGNSNFRMGGLPKTQSKILNLKSEILIIEADEHFASFLNYWPKIIVLTTIEKDHLDYYKNLNNIIKAFRKFVGHLPKDGVLVANKDDKNISRLLNPKSEIRNPKQIQNSKFKILNYSLKQKESKELKKILKVPGEYNVSNALAALTVARLLKIPDKISFQALSEYKGAWRRFEIVEADLRGYQRGTTRKIIVVNDYAHHPTEIKATLEAAREKWPQRKIWCVFQPHQYQRTYYLFDDFVKVFRQAPVDKLIIADIYDVAGRENKKIKKAVNSKKLVQAIQKAKKSEGNFYSHILENMRIVYLPKNKILSYLKKNLKGEEVVIIMGAGDIYLLEAQLQAK